MITRAVGHDDRIMLKHGSGGRAMRALIEQVFARGFPSAPDEEIGLAAMDDGAVLRVGNKLLVVTTDAHVIHPIFFPGGDIGRLAAAGTINDLAMMGATDSPALTCAVIVEEGFPRRDLERIQQSLLDACLEAGATIVAGDTKVMGKGELDGIVLNTTGVAVTDHVVPGAGLRPGDRVLVTGTVGDHGLAVLAARHGLGVDGLCSDVAPINGLVRAALAAGGDAIAAMKDPTRGGVASALHEMAEKGRVGVVLVEDDIPMRAEVRSAAELLGIDPLHVANEGKALIGVRPEAAGRVLEAVRAHPLGRDAAIIGTCVAERPGSVVLDTGVGRRLLTEPDGELLPRIC